MAIELDFNLTPKQSLVFSSNATEILYGGAAGSGKSHLLRVLALFFAYSIPKIQIYLLRRQVKDLILNHMTGESGFPSMLEPLVREKLCKINVTTHEIKFENGAIIHLCHLNDSNTLHSFQGVEAHVLLFDELTHFEEYQYTYLRSRCRLGALQKNVPAELRDKLPLIVGATNPSGVGHNWVKQAFVDPKPAMEVWRTQKEDGGMLRQYIPAKHSDNPYLDDDYADKLHGIGNSRIVQAMLDGDWDIADGGFFEDVWDRSVHIVPRFNIPIDWKLSRSFDYGFSAPYSVGWWAESGDSPIMLHGKEIYFPRGTLFRIGELYGWNGKSNQGCKDAVSTIANKIIQFEIERGYFGHIDLASCVADAAIYSAERDVSIAAEMANAGVHWVPADKRPGSRVTGLQNIRTRLHNAKHLIDAPRLYVTEDCVHFIRTIPVIPFSQNNPDDVDTHAEDHVLDEVRYRCNITPKTFSYATVQGL